MTEEMATSDEAFFEQLTQALDERADEITDMVDANESERETIMRLSKLVRHGHKLAYLRVRKDGQNHIFKADWLCRLFRLPHADAPIGSHPTPSPGMMILGDEGNGR